ncbi:MAG: TonB-dependent receptor [Bacteroidales bacterium]|nr:TonB-dependent receptor [Bacteroidales bacterium]
MKSFLIAIITGSALLVSGISFAQESPKADTLSPVTVVAQRIVREIVPVQYLAGEQMQRLTSYSVADAIRYFSGAQIKDYGGIGGLKSVNIRSLGSQHVGVFYDGLEMGNAQNGIVDLGRFSLDNLEAVSVYNGQKSAIFQSAKDYASASAVYLQSKIPVFAPGKKDNINLGFKTGSFALVNPSAFWEHKFSDRLSLSASAEYMHTNGRYRFTYSTKGGYDTTAYRHNGDVRMERVEMGLFRFIEGGHWKVKAYFYDSERGFPGACVREEPGRFRHQDRQWDRNFFLQTQFKKEFSPRYSLLFNGKYAYDYLHYLSDPREDVTTMYINSHFRQKEGYASLAHLFNVTKWWSLSLSDDIQYNKLNADLTGFIYPNRLTFLNAAATSVSLDRFKFQASLLYTYVKDRSKYESAHFSTDGKFTPSVIASYHPFKGIGLDIRAFYKRVFRLPTFNDLYYTFVGNINLKPESTTQYNLGAVFSHKFKTGFFKTLDASLDLYYNTVKNKIVAVPTSNQFRWTMLNFGRVEIKGLDAVLQSSFATGPVDWTTRVNYTYQRAEDVTDKNSQWYRGQIPYIPWHSGSVIVTADYGKWALTYSFIYTGERYESVANIAENYSPAWYTHDMGITRSFSIGPQKRDLKITLEVNNILNQQYEVVQCYPMPGTNIKIRLNFEL